MKKFTKKALSILLSLVMVVSALAVGSVSAFAAVDVRPYVAVVEGSGAIASNYFVFAPTTTGYYAITTSAVKAGVSAASELEVKTVHQNGNSFNTQASASSSSYTVEAAKTATATDPLPIGCNTTVAYTPATVIDKLVAGEKYYIDVDRDVDATTYLTISKTENYFDYCTVKSNVTYVHHYGTNNVPVTKTEELTTGIGVALGAYYGNATTVAVPSTVYNLPVVSVDLGNTITVIKNRITSVTLPEGIKRIKGMNRMYALSSINLPSTLEEIGSYAFYGDHALAGKIVIPASVKNVGNDAFYDTGLTSVEFVGKDTAVGSYAFGYKEVLNEATVDPTDVTFAPVAGFVVLAPADSLAAKYAADNGFITYDLAKCNAGNHPYAVATTPATIFAAGVNVYTCPACGVVVNEAIAKKKFKISSLKSTKKGKITVKAAKQSGIKGYKVQYSTSKKFAKKSTKTVTVNTTKALSKTISGLKSKKTYYVRVRAYKVENGKNVYSSYTATKSVKVK